MKNKFFKRTLSLVMVLMLAFSTMAVSIVSANAANENITYNIEFSTPSSQGRSYDDIKIKVNGTQGSTDWHNVGKVGSFEGTETASFTDVNVGTIESVTVKNAGGAKGGAIDIKASDGWYPNYIKVNGTKIYGGRWVDDEKEVTMKVTDNVYKLTINTGNSLGAGTDSDVEVTLYDANGHSSSTINASAVHPNVNAFEKGDSMSMYMYVPSNFGTVSKIKFTLPESGVYYIAKAWQLKSVSGEKVQGANMPETFNKTVNVWIADSYKDPNNYTVTL